MTYPEFKARYNILAAKLVAKAKNDKGAAGAVLDSIKLEKEKFRLGHTKVFFRAGILGYMEEVHTYDCEPTFSTKLNVLHHFCFTTQNL